MADISGGNFNTSNVKLERRDNWVQHFVIVAGTQIVAGSGISNFIGKAKEVRYTKDPSGFSSTGIAADRTGARFAEITTAAERSARKSQDTPAGAANKSRTVESKQAFRNVDEARVRVGVRVVQSSVAKFAAMGLHP